MLLEVPDDEHELVLSDGEITAMVPVLDSNGLASSSVQPGSVPSSVQLVISMLGHEACLQAPGFDAASCHRDAGMARASNSGIAHSLAEKGRSSICRQGWCCTNPLNETGKSGNDCTTLVQ